MLIIMMNESQSRPHGGSKLLPLKTMMIEVESLLDLVKFTYFYYEKLGMIKPLICYFQFKKNCYYWIWLKSNKLIYVFSSGKCPKNGEKWITFSPFRGDKIDFTEFNSIKNNSIGILECRSKILSDYLKNTLSFVLSDIGGFPGFKVDSIIEIIRLASYYGLPIFLYRRGELNIMIIGLIPELSLPGLNMLAYHLIAEEGVRREIINNQGYALYIEGEGSIGEVYKFLNKVKVLDVFAPVIKVKKILGEVV